jgi:hypothetical protein
MRIAFQEMADSDFGDRRLGCHRSSPQDRASLRARLYF